MSLVCFTFETVSERNVCSELSHTDDQTPENSQYSCILWNRLTVFAMLGKHMNLRYHQKWSICGKVLQKNYTQLPRLSFTDIERDVSGTLPIEKPSGTKEVPLDIPSMGRICFARPSKEHRDREKGAGKRAENEREMPALFPLSGIPTWYERLNAPSSYRLEKDPLLGQVSVPYRSFQRCYARVLSSYTDRFLSLTKPHLKELLLDFPNKELPTHVQEQQIKINTAVRRLSDLSLNTFIIYQRLKVKRNTPPFYLHQQFLVHLGEKNTVKLLDLYFDFPEPRPLYLKREEFERFMSLLLGLKISGDHRSLLKRIVEVFEDIRANGAGIQLTPFEETKYLSILLGLWKEQQIPQEEKFNRILKLRSNEECYPKKLNFCPAMWNIVISHFPEFSDEVMKMMAEEIGINRSTAEIFLRHLNTEDQLNNALELMKLKHFHLDPWLLNIVVDKYISFGKSMEALDLVTKVLSVFEDVSSLTWVFPTQKYYRTAIFRIDVLNKTLQQLFNEDANSEFAWLKYKFKPSPLTLGRLAVSLQDKERIELLKLMIQQNIPLVNKHALELLENKDFTTLSLVLNLVNNSKEFNKRLHQVSTDAKYDTIYYKQFIQDAADPTFELKQIFRASIKIYDDFESLEGMDLVRADAADQLLKLNEELKKFDN